MRCLATPIHSPVSRSSPLLPRGRSPMTLRIFLRRALVCCAFAATCLSRVVVAQTETLTGTVRGDSGAVIANAVITSTPAGAGATASVTTRSNSVGRWTIVMPARAADYFVTVAAIGWIQQRIDVKSNGGTSPVVVDASLKRAPVQLGPVRVTESTTATPATRVSDRRRRRRYREGRSGELRGVRRRGPGRPDGHDLTGARNHGHVGREHGLPTFSALGLSGSQNNVMLNGLAFGGGDVPRDIIGAVRVTASTYDVSRGGFSGAQLSVTQAPGSNFSQRLAHVTFDAPSLQFTDHVGRQLGQQYTNVQLSGNATGPIVLDRVFYNVSFQGGRRSSDLASLLTSDPSTLLRLGLSQDSVWQVMTAAQARGIPVSSGGIPDHRQTENGSVLARLDWTPTDAAQGSLHVAPHQPIARFIRRSDRASRPRRRPESKRRRRHRRILRVVPLDGPERPAVRRARGHDRRDAVQRAPRRARARDLAARRRNDRPHVVARRRQLVAAAQHTRVGSGGVQSDVVEFGRRAHHWRATPTHGSTTCRRLRIRQRARHVPVQLDRRSAGEPSGVVRALVRLARRRGRRPDGRRSRSATNGGAGSHQRDVRPAARRQRASRRRSPTTAAVDSVFHLRTDAAPSDAAVSPRASFSWGIGNNGTTGIPGFGAPWGFISGGIGEFRNDLSPGADHAGDRRTTVCPTARPAALRRRPRCRRPTSRATCTNRRRSRRRAPAGRIRRSSAASPTSGSIDPNFQSQRSWRGNLTLRGPFITKLFRFSADVTYSLNLHQQSPVDVNFVPTCAASWRRRATGRRSRQPSSIVPATGAGDERRLARSRRCSAA